ncbi:hypothetical protein DPMN_010591 [Dreissena polymorpha]|uniref:Uncharacterized protein n=1 Tax=Dreissena polymorpha TaxID=45954 RepID=A0A9D4N068_DREPO|nr:hypothetical protein DPMN_010591 [Dreissena polymorpha]
MRPKHRKTDTATTDVNRAAATETTVIASTTHVTLTLKTVLAVMTTMNHVTTAVRTFQNTTATGTRFHAGFGIVTVLTKMKNQIVIK